MKAICVILTLGLVTVAVGVGANDDDSKLEEDGGVRTAPARGGVLRFLEKGQRVKVERDAGGLRVHLLSKGESGRLDAEITDVQATFVVIRSRVARPRRPDDKADVTFVVVDRVIAAHAIDEIVVHDPHGRELQEQKDDILDKLK